MEEHKFELLCYPAPLYEKQPMYGQTTNQLSRVKKY